MTSRNFDLIAFDWDGTLFDSTQIIVRCIQAAVKDVGGTVPTDEAAGYVIGLGLMQALAHAAPDVPHDRYPLLGERYRYHYQLHVHDLSLFDGVLPLLAALKARGHLLVVATGKSRHGLDEALQTVQLKGVFDASRTADKTAGKPDPKMLHELMAELGISPSRTLMVGDTTHDLQMAVNAGCQSLGVSYGAHSPEAFAALGPLHIAHSVPDMHDWLLANG
ncbi:MAG: HAD-IA family hydrolase [Polaromonas sp.]|jgi:phosphoglycolate phosphatase